MTTLVPTEAVSPSEIDSKSAQIASRKLSQIYKSKSGLKVRVAGSDEIIELPAVAVRLLIDLLSALAEGDAVTLIPIHAELTTQQAADLLGVSRPFLIKQLEEGGIPHRKVGTHRRIMFSDLMRYKQEMISKRQESLDELSSLGQELNDDY